MAEGNRAWKWWMAGVLFLATVLTYLDRQTVAICEDKICAEFNLNGEQFGQVLAAFRWTYGLMQIPAGLMADHLPLRMTFGLAVGLWSLAGAAAAAAFRLPVLKATRAVLGMGETFNWPCASRIVANMFPPADRSLASGIFNSGAAIGALVAPTVIGGLAAVLGWRGAFATLGVAGGAWLVSGSRRPLAESRAMWPCGLASPSTCADNGSSPPRSCLSAPACRERSFCLVHGWSRR